MTLLNKARLVARQFGLEVHRYNLAHSLEARFFASLAQHDIGLVIDVGANDGGYGDHLRRGGYHGAIASFEPLSGAHRALKARAAGDALWTVMPACALGATPDTLEIHVAGNSKSSSLLPMLHTHLDAAPQSATVSSERVAVMRLDDVKLPAVDRPGRTFLKIDTQGYEMPVLQGATRTLEGCVGVQLEMSLLPLYEGQALYRDLIAWLEHQGFTLWALLPGFSDPRSGRMLQMDGVFFRM